MPYSLEYLSRIKEKLREVFISLHNHSEYSNLRLLDSTNKIKAMVKYVASLGQHGIALTDHECLSGHLELLKVVSELKESGEIPEDFKPILGNEIYLVDEEDMYDKMYNGEYVNFYHFLLLATDAVGHEYLRKLSSKAWIRMFSHKGMERVPTYYTDLEEIVEEQGHLIASTACLGGYLPKKALEILQAQEEELDDDYIDSLKQDVDDFLQYCISIFGEDNFYVELQPSNDEAQIAYNEYALIIAKAYGLKTIITTDAHYLSPENRGVHKAFLTSSEEEEGNREVDGFYQSTYFHSVDELFDKMSYLDIEDIEACIMNTKEIADKCTGEYDLFHDQEIPVTPIPDESTWKQNDKMYKLGEQYHYINHMIQKGTIYDRYMINICLNAMEKKIVPEKYEESLERLNIECEQLIGVSEAKGQPVSAYLTTMKKMIDLIWENAESLVMPGRGSAGAYIINYLLDIVQINPLEQGVEMPYFRFIHKSKIEYPDIDIDVSSHKRNKVFSEVQKYYKSIGGDMIRVCTFGTETSKSAIQTASRGLGINSDIGLYLASLIPVERGKVWSIHDCYYGNEEKDRKRITEFKNIVDEHEGLLETVLGIEGLVNKRSSHASGVIPMNRPITDRLAIMRTPSGELVTQYELHTAEEMGCIKYDYLITKACACIQVTLEMLHKYGKIKWGDSLRDTYNKYIHPDIIEKEDPEMWKLLNEGKLINAFQFDSQVGSQAIKSIQPQNLLEATNANNLMRLMVEDGKEQPLDMYVRYKENPKEWYDDMISFGLQEDEIKILENHLKKDCGVCSTQERMMLMSMDENISGFDVPQSNIIRKAVAKKSPKSLAQAKKLFYEGGEKRGTSKKLLDYVWFIQLAMQFGYGFSIIHGVEYTYILIQELNLVFRFPPIYWNTAVLLVESGALEQEDTGIEEIDNNKKEKTTQYGKVATAIGNLQEQNVDITLPDINTSDMGFVPKEDINSIQFGLKGIMGINQDTATTIIENRPYKSLQDFYERMVLVKREVTLSTGKTQQKSLVTETQTITLIKSGAFDSIESEPREVILENFIRLCNPPKEKLDTRTIDKVIDMGIIPDSVSSCLKYYNFRSYITSLDSYKDENSNIKWYVIEDEDPEMTDYASQFLLDNFVTNEFEPMIENKDYRYSNTGLLEVALNTKRKGSFEFIYNKLMTPFLNWLRSKECLDKYNDIMFDMIKFDKMQGSVSKWEMESLNYYYHEHELSNINAEDYDIVSFKDLPEEPVVVGFNKWNGFNYPKFELHRIVGTVLDRDKNKHIVTLLTPTGTVTLKFQSGAFAHYDKQISELNEDGSKTVIEAGWFKRGTLLMITGFRRGDQFRPKKYKNSIFQHTVQKIERVDEEGRLVIQSERKRIDS